jgi:hypothetical protein
MEQRAPLNGNDLFGGWLIARQVGCRADHRKLWLPAKIAAKPAIDTATGGRCAVRTGQRNEPLMDNQLERGRNLPRCKVPPGQPLRH